VHIVAVDRNADTKAEDDFKITRFWMEDGKPMFEFENEVKVKI
jgi:hypothetical protein